MSSGAPQERGVSIRMPSQALLCVNSADGEQFNQFGLRIDNNSPANIYINRQRPLMFGYMTRIELTEINFQWNIPNVNEYNNTLTFVLYDNAGVIGDYFRIEIPKGFYTAPELAIAVRTALNAAPEVVAAGLTFNVLVGGADPNAGTANTTVSITNPTFQISRTAGTGYFRILPYNLSSAVSGLPALQDDLANMMGLTPYFSPSLSAYYSAISGSYSSMLYTPYVDIVSNLLTKNQNVRDGDTTMVGNSGKLARVYFANNEFTPRVVTITYNGTGAYDSSTDNSLGCAPCTLRREFNSPKVISWNTTENVDVIDLQLVDYRQQLLPIEFIAPVQVGTAPGPIAQFNGNTADFQFTLMASEI